MRAGSSTESRENILHTQLDGLLALGYGPVMDSTTELDDTFLVGDEGRPCTLREWRRACPDCDGTGRVTYGSDEWSPGMGHYTTEREGACETCCPDDSPHWLRTDGPEAYL